MSKLLDRQYIPLKQIPLSKNDLKLTLSADESLAIETTPQVTYFSTYVYLWPSPFAATSGEEDLEPVPLEQPYLLGAQILHRQEWRLLGHARGELLHSLPLAPGEEASIEIISWDRNVYRRDEEMISDLEREVEQNRVYKDSHEVLREMGNEQSKQWKVGGGFGLNLGFLKVNAGGGYDAQSHSESLDRSTRNRIVETTDRLSSKIRDQRKTSISSTREFGQEKKVSRKLTNTNRCHTVVYHYYEVLRNYEIATSLASPAARPCIFVKQAHPIDRVTLLAEPEDYGTFLKALRWLYTHSHLIARGLLHRSFYKALELVPDLLAHWSLRRGVAATGIDFDPVLTPAVRALVQQVQATWDTGFGTARYQLKLYIALCMPWLIAKVLEDQDSLKQVLENPDPNKQNELTDSVERFLNTWNYSYPSVSPEVCQGLYVVESERNRGFLFDPIMRLKTEYTRWVYGPAPGEEPTPDQVQRMRDVSEVVRLLRHIEEHYMHYFQLIWAAKDPDQIQLETNSMYLPDGTTRLSDVIKPQIVGIYGDYVIFPYTAMEEGAQLAELVQAFLDREAEEPNQSEAVLPTNGIATEPQLGEFTACEPFIQEHRIHDLKLKELEVRTAEMENRRRSKKIRNCELENPDCCPSEKYGFFHRLLCRLRGGTEG
jgi:hypothetical protein